MRIITTRVAGVTFGRRQETLASLKIDSVEVCPEPTNPWDNQALAVWGVTDAGERVQVGYVPRELAAEIAPYVQGLRRIAGEIVGWQGGTDGLSIGITIAFACDDND